MKILVTGAAGFIGAALSFRLLERGDEVVGVDNLDPYYDVSLKQARLDRFRTRTGFRDVRADISDRGAVADLFARERPAHGRQSRRAGRGPAFAREPPCLCQREPRGLHQHPGGMPPPRRPPSGLRVLELRVRRQSHAAVLRAAQCRSSAVALRRHQEGERADGAQLQPPLRAPRHRAAVLHRLRTLGTAGHGVVPIHPQHPRRPADRPCSTGAVIAGTSRTSTTSSKGSFASSTGPPPRTNTGARSRRILPPAPRRTGSTTSATAAGWSWNATSRCWRRAWGARRRRTSSPCSPATCPTPLPMSMTWNGNSTTGPGTPIEVGVRRFVEWYKAFHGVRG